MLRAQSAAPNVAILARLLFLLWRYGSLLEGIPLLDPGLSLGEGLGAGCRLLTPDGRGYVPIDGLAGRGDLRWRRCRLALHVVRLELVFQLLPALELLVLLLHFVVEHLLYLVNDQVAFIDDFLAPFVDDLLLVGAKLAHRHWLHFSIVVAEEDLVLHDLEAGAPLGEHDLVLHLLHLVVLMGEVSRDRFHLLLVWSVAFLRVQRK